jgi:hypothetical protein
MALQNRSYFYINERNLVSWLILTWQPGNTEQDQGRRMSTGLFISWQASPVLPPKGVDYLTAYRKLMSLVNP